MTSVDRKVRLGTRLEGVLSDAGYQSAYVIGSATDPPVPAEDSDAFLNAAQSGFAEATRALLEELSEEARNPTQGSEGEPNRSSSG
jgi:hypothetical protein